ncbi:hypothetical protein [Rhodococcus sp. Q]|uniref:hypothetical protein n=1 Tax=Rhodococcus sp. Q TaxID=2502252 RepID=UPI002015EA89|nr:hypothetical protein [Rhodococcus sp. Q]
MRRPRAQRLRVVDEMFLRTHRGYGTPVVMQGLWRGGDVDASELQRVHDTLALGPLSHTVVRPRVPGARPRRQHGTAPWPIEWATQPIARESVVLWADEVAQRPVDPTAGAGWRMAAAPLSGGGTVVSLVCSHVVADARGLAAAIAAAMVGEATRVPPDPEHPARDDLADAARMVTVVGARTLRAVAGLVRHPSRRAELRSAPVRLPDSSDHHDGAQAPEALIVDVDAARWDAEAARTGGTPNSLLVTVAAAIAGIDDTALQVSIPVSRRTDTDSASNAIDMTEVTVHPSDSPATVRALLRGAYLQPPMSSPAGFPAELLQLVPDRVAYRLAPDPGERDVLCSNIGPIPVALSSLGGARAEAIATRAVHPGIDARQLAASANRLSVYLCRLGETYTLSLVSKDPGLRDRTAAALAAHGLTAHHWDDPA